MTVILIVLLWGGATAAFVQRFAAREKEARKDLEKAEKLNEDFLSAISHELRTPLSSVLGWSEILLRQENLPAEVREGLEVISRNAGVQIDLVAQLLDTRRIISGTVKLEHEELDLPAIAGCAREKAMKAAERRKIAIVDSVEWPDDALVYGDPARVEQAVASLLMSGVKFTPDRGTIKMKIQCDYDEARIVITESGLSIEKSTDVFDLSSRFWEQSSFAHRGLLTSLSLARAVAELHGGKMEVLKQKGEKETEFRIVLPAERRSSSAGNGAM